MLRNTLANSYFQILIILTLSIIAQPQKTSFFIVSSIPPPSPSLSNIFYTSLSAAIMLASTWQNINLTNPFTIYVGNGGTIMHNLDPTKPQGDPLQIFTLIILPFSCDLQSEELKNYINYCTNMRPIVYFPDRYNGNFFIAVYANLRRFIEAYV